MIPGQLALGSPEFARWLNGQLTLACGRDVHEICRGVISTLGIECPCLCECHVTKVPNESTMKRLDNEPPTGYGIPTKNDRSGARPEPPGPKSDCREDRFERSGRTIVAALPAGAVNRGARPASNGRALTVIGVTL